MDRYQSEQNSPQNHSLKDRFSNQEQTGGETRVKGKAGFRNDKSNKENNKYSLSPMLVKYPNLLDAF